MNKKLLAMGLSVSMIAGMLTGCSNASDDAQTSTQPATQQTTAPGSTLKLLSTIAGMEEGVIDENTYIECTGTFDYVDPPINCWDKNGHGGLDIRTAIEQSCNYFFYYGRINCSKK